VNWTGGAEVVTVPLGPAVYVGISALGALVVGMRTVSVGADKDEEVTLAVSDAGPVGTSVPLGMGIVAIGA